MMMMLCLESLSDDETHMLLLILSQLVPQLSIAAAKSVTAAAAGEVDESDSDDELMDVDCQVGML